MFRFIAKSNRRHFIDSFVAFVSINGFLENKNESMFSFPTPIIKAMSHLKQVDCWIKGRYTLVLNNLKEKILA